MMMPMTVAISRTASPHTRRARSAGQVTTDTDIPVIATSDYVARRVLIEGFPEGFRSSGTGVGSTCTQTTIEDCFVDIHYPDTCTDWHGDGVQAYGSPHLTITNSVFILNQSEACGGTAPIFIPQGQGNDDTVTINGVLVEGGGYPFRLGVGGTAEDIFVIRDSWNFVSDDDESDDEMRRRRRERRGEAGTTTSSTHAHSHRRRARTHIVDD